MRVLLASEPATPGQPNEDFAAIAPGTAVLLDGATERPGTESGCSHGPGWYAHMLGGFLLARATWGDAGLAALLADGIEHVNGLHAGTCDLRNRRTPGATVVIARQRHGRLDYLVLSDSVLLIEPLDGSPQVITDTHSTEVAGPLRRAVRPPPTRTAAHETALHGHRSAVTAARNQPGGFWLAASDPRAADHALTGSVPLAGLAGVALLSDGASRLADRFGLITWPEICALFASEGPHALIRRVRAAEATDPDGSRWPRSKAADDATAIYWPLSG